MASPKGFDKEYIFNLIMPSTSEPETEAEETEPEPSPQPKAEPEPKPTTGDWYKVKLLTAALADAARCEAEGKTFYGAYVHFTTPGVKNITIGEGGLQVLLQYYKENKDPGWD